MSFEVIPFSAMQTTPRCVCVKLEWILCSSDDIKFCTRTWAVVPDLLAQPIQTHTGAPLHVVPKYIQVQLGNNCKHWSLSANNNLRFSSISVIPALSASSSILNFDNSWSNFLKCLSTCDTNFKLLLMEQSVNTCFILHKCIYMYYKLHTKKSTRHFTITTAIFKLLVN